MDRLTSSTSSVFVGTPVDPQCVVFKPDGFDDRVLFVINVSEVDGSHQLEVPTVDSVDSDCCGPSDAADAATEDEGSQSLGSRGGIAYCLDRGVPSLFS